MNRMPVQVTVIDDDKEDFELIRDFLAKIPESPFELKWISEAEGGLQAIRAQEADVYLVDYNLGSRTGFALLDEAARLTAPKPMILLTGQDDRRLDFAAMERGAADYLPKSNLGPESLERSLRYSLNHYRTQLSRIETARLTTEMALAAEAKRSKDRFFASVSHDLRSPLASIVSFSELLMEEDLSPADVQRFAEIINKTGLQLLELLNDLLDLSKLEDGKFEIHKESFDWRRVVEDVLELFRLKIQAKGLQFTINHGAHLPLFLFSDERRFRQILTNLVSNAIKFTDQGSITIDCRARDREFDLTVTDSGIGMCPVEQMKIFEAFQQGRSDISKKYGGTGLGLDLSRRLARALGGELSLVESQAGKGSVFNLSLPLESELMLVKS